MILNYEFDGRNDTIDFDFEVDINEAVRVITPLVMRDEMLNGVLSDVEVEDYVYEKIDHYKHLYEDELKDYFEDEAKQSFEDSMTDSYTLYGVSRNDFL